MSPGVAVRRPPVTKRQFGARLRELRKALGLSQEAVAHKLGMPQNSWSNWERGETSPGMELIDRIAKALGCDPGDLAIEPKAIPDIKRGRPFNDPQPPPEPPRGRRPKKGE